MHTTRCSRQRSVPNTAVLSGLESGSEPVWRRHERTGHRWFGRTPSEPEQQALALRIGNARIAGPRASKKRLEM